MAFVTRDRFGNESMVVGLKDKKGTGYPKGYFEIGRQLFKIEVSESKKDGVEAWAKITKVDRNRKRGF